MPEKLSLIINQPSFAYRVVRYIYRRTKKIIIKFLPLPPNPYNNITLTPRDLKIDVIDKNYQPNANYPSYTTITPVLNEENSIVEMLKSIEAQTLKPDQVIIVDGGSSDNTIGKINKYISSTSLDILLISSRVSNIGTQRNIAIKHSRNNILMNVDAGTYLDVNYAANSIGPFYEDPNIDLVGGVHYPKVWYPWSIYLTPTQHFAVKQDPYGACLVYKKDIALKVGLYAEYLTYAGEDTLFCYRYKKASHHWVLNREAIILWDHPLSFNETKKKVYNYSMANFEIGLWPYFHYEQIYEPNFTFSWITKILKSNYKEFLIKQAEIEINKRNIKGLCFLLFEDNINIKNQKFTESIICKFINNNFKTFYINFENILSNKALTTPIYFNTDHTLLELNHCKNFSLKDIKDRYTVLLNNSIFIINFLNRKKCLEILELKKHFSNMKIVYIAINFSPENTAPKNDHLKDIIPYIDWVITDSNHNEKDKPFASAYLKNKIIIEDDINKIPEKIFQIKGV